MKFKTLYITTIVCTIVFQCNAQDSNDDWKYFDAQTAKTLEKAGDYLAIGLPVAAGLTTLIVNDKEGSKQFIKSYGTNILLTYGMKYLIDKRRPGGAVDGKAFPSGHTSSAFSGASFIQRRFGWKYGAPAYLLASFVGFSRTFDVANRHDEWDVLGGIIVGVGSTYLFTTPYQKEHFELTFTSGDNNYSLGFKYKF